MVIKVHHLKCSQIFFEPYKNLLPSTSQIPWFTQKSNYITEFKAVAEKTRHKMLDIPWRNAAAINFWQYYLNSADVDNITAAKAFEHIVPLFATGFSTVEIADQNDVRATLQGFHYPHGNAVILNLEYRSTAGLPLADAVDLVTSSRQKLSYEAQFPHQDRTNRTYSFNGLRDAALKEMRIRSVGGAPLPSSAWDETFHVVTAIAAQGDINLVPANDPDLQSALRGLGDMNQFWKNAPPLENIADYMIDYKGQTQTPPSHGIYASNHGRMVWFPGFFPASNAPKLACYHRNLVTASMQTISLLEMTHVTNDLIEHNKGNASIKRFGYYAAEKLGRLYRGEETYRSISVHKLITDYRRRASLEKMRLYHNLKPLDFTQ